MVAEDGALVRAGIRALLDHMPAVSAVTEAADGREALNRAHEDHPDVILMDIAMPAMNGLEAARRIASELPDVKVIMLSMHANEEYVWQALRSGACGYVLKDSSPSELEHALDAVSRGETYLTPSLSKLLERFIGRLRDLSPIERLTPRQREVLQLVAEGHTNRSIAAVLGISIKTVETHRAQLMETLDIHDIAGLVRFAIRVGLTS
jgi:DNA-binding NarL/FixJ family response regulator